MPINYDMKILLVEDSRVTRKLEAEVLTQMGFTNIIEAEHGDEAIAILQEEPDIQLIISDWNMPWKDGYDLLVWVRSDPSCHNIPFIMATSQAEKKQTEKASAAGVNGFITKPFDAWELQNIIEDIFEIKETVQKAPTKQSISKKLAGKVPLKVAHIQITDHLVLGMLKHHISEKIFSPRYFDLETICMTGWNPVQHALEKGDIDAALILAPIAMDLFSANIPIKLILFAHRNGSICVRNTATTGQLTMHDFFKGKTFYIPHILSIHHMLLTLYLREIGLKPGLTGRPGVDVFFEVVPPIKMQEFMSKNPEVGGFSVAEPLGTKAIKSGVADLLFFTGDLWKNHPCCIVAFRKEFIDAYTDAVFEFTHMFVRAGQEVFKDIHASAEIGVNFLDPQKTLGLSVPILENVLKEPSGIKTDNLYPSLEDLDRIQRYMNSEMGIGTIIDLEKFADLRFADDAYKDMNLSMPTSILQPPSRMIAKTIQATLPTPDRTSATEHSLPVINRSKKNVFEISESPHEIIFQISSEMRLVDRVVAYVREFMKNFGFDLVSNMISVLRELLINAVEHGNKNIPEKQIQCSVARIKDSLFRIVVKDEGDGFNYKQLKIAQPDSNQIRKRGYPLIKAFSEQIEFNSKGNEITAYVKLYRETQFDITEENGWKIIQPTGNITASIAGKFRKLLSDLVDEGYSRFRFDCKKVEDIDSISLSVFITLVKLLLKKGVEPQLELINASQEIANLFRMTGLNRNYLIYDSELK